MGEYKWVSDMAAQSNAAPIIIKRKKVVGGGGHHGGAWKVAYADFVTAMMAFFMLMWLLNATTEKQRKGIADYFTPTVAINRVSGAATGRSMATAPLPTRHCPSAVRVRRLWRDVTPGPKGPMMPKPQP